MNYPEQEPRAIFFGIAVPRSPTAAQLDEVGKPQLVVTKFVYETWTFLHDMCYYIASIGI